MKRFKVTAVMQDYEADASQCKYYVEVTQVDSTPENQARYFTEEDVPRLIEISKNYLIKEAAEKRLEITRNLIYRLFKPARMQALVDFYTSVIKAPVLVKI